MICRLSTIYKHLEHQTNQEWEIQTAIYLSECKSVEELIYVMIFLCATGAVICVIWWVSVTWWAVWCVWCDDGPRRLSVTRCVCWVMWVCDVRIIICIYSNRLWQIRLDATRGNSVNYVRFAFKLRGLRLNECAIGERGNHLYERHWQMKWFFPYNFKCWNLFVWQIF